MTVPGNTDQIERGWCAGVRAGDERAFAALFRRYYEPLCRFAFRWTGSRDAAEDAVQAVFASIWDGHARWMVSGTVRAYLYGAVRHQLLSRHREQEVRARHASAVLRLTAASAESSAWARPDSNVESEELRGAIARAVAALPPKGRQAFELSRRDGLSYAEIAEVMGISRKTVEVHLTRALASLRAALGAYLAAVLLIHSR